MKRICFFSGDITRAGGTERIVSLIANPLAEIPDTEIVILSLFESADTPAFNCSPRIVRHHLFDHPVSLKLHALSALWRLRKFLLREKIDILIDVDIILSLISIPASLALPVRNIAWEHFHFYENLGCRTRDWGRKLAMRYADVIVTLTQGDRDTYLTARPKAQVICIHNPLVPPSSEPHYDPDSKIILSAGHLNALKRFDTIPQIAKPIFDKHPDWQWHIAGEGELRDKITNEIRQYGLEKNIRLLGKVTDMTALYAQASIFVLTSSSEGFGLVLLEATAMQVPCISYDCPVGPREIIDNGITGELVPNGDTIRMSETILGLIENREKRLRYSQATVESLRKWEIDTSLAEWKRLLELTS